MSRHLSNPLLFSATGRAHGMRGKKAFSLRSTSNKFVQIF
jgi:hypothetical protein